MEWVAFAQRHPIGDEHLVAQMERVALQIAKSTHEVHGKGMFKGRLEDFGVTFGPPQRPGKTPEEMLQVFQLADAFSKQMKSRRQGN